MKMIISSSSMRVGVAFALALAVVGLMPIEAAAQQSPMGGILCGVLGFVYGNFGRALATLAVISLGILAMLGKLSWGLGIMVALGIGIVFGSGWITRAFLTFAGGEGNGWIACDFAPFQ